MTRHIIVFGAGKSATILITYLLHQCQLNNWRLTVADSNRVLAQSKVGTSSFGNAVEVQVEDAARRSEIIQNGDLVVSMLPPSLHHLVALDCLQYGKHLLTASYIDNDIRLLSPEIKQKGLLFLCEAGLDPGIDHMSAMRLINSIREKGGTIVSFKSHCGGLVAPESNNNPWKYKISWNPRSIVQAGSSGATFMEHKQVKHVGYKELFEDCPLITIRDLGQLAWYPNRDSLPYMKLYDLEKADTFIRTTLRYPAFPVAWTGIVKSGLTGDKQNANETGRTFKEWSAPLTTFVKEENKEQYEYLGVFEDKPIPGQLTSSAEILQSLLEERLMMKPEDRDMIVMLHEVEYYTGKDLHKTESLLVVKGDDHVNTAMATTVGLPLGIASCLILKGEISLTGLSIPVHPEIYQPVLSELETLGIRFEETDMILKQHSRQNSRPA